MACIVLSRYAPDQACQIIMACIVLHNIAVSLRLPEPDPDYQSDEDDDDGVNDENDPNVLSGRMARDRIVERHFS